MSEPDRTFMDRLAELAAILPPGYEVEITAASATLKDSSGRLFRMGPNGDPVEVTPTNARPTVPDVMPLVRAVYARHGVGCCLHILTDDGNCEQGDADFVLRYAREQEHADCIAAAEMLVRMTETQRLKVYHSEKSPQLR